MLSPFLQRRRRLRVCAAAALILTLITRADAAVQRLTYGQRSNDLPQVNGAGQVVWVTALPGQTALEFWDGASVRQIATGVDTSVDPQLSETGQIAWQSWGRAGLGLFLWDGSQVRLLASTRSALQWRLNAVGQVVWQASDGKVSQIYLWDGAAVRQLSHGDKDSLNPRINGAGQVAWESQGHIYLWDGQAVRKLTQTTWFVGDSHNPQINDAGQVAWIGQDDGTGVGNGVSLWDRGTVRRADAPEYQSDVEELRLGGEGTVAMVVGVNGDYRHLYVWDGMTMRRLTDEFNQYRINAAGAVAWDNDGEIFLWDGAAIRPLYDTGLYYPELQMNDRGEVVWQVSNGTTGGSNIARWDGSSVRVISATPEEANPGVYSKHGLQLGSRGHAVWVGALEGGGAEIFLYTPPGLIDLELSAVPGGQPATGRVTLPAPAPPGGAVVTLASANPAVAAVPPSVTVPPGERAADFPVTTFPVRPSTSVVISASYEGQTGTAALQVLQAGIDLPGGITQVSDNLLMNQTPRLNDHGQLVWQAGRFTDEFQLFLWTGLPIPAIRPLMTERRGQAAPWINNRGEIVWENDPLDDRTLYYWNGGASRRFAPIGNGNGAEQINDAGQILWESWDNYRPTLTLWDGAAFHTLDSQLAGEADPALSNRGHVAWQHWAGTDNQLLLWDGATTRALAHGSAFRFSIQLNDREQVIWREGDVRDAALFLWDGAAVRHLADHTAEARLNDQGWVVWQTAGQIFLWDGSLIRPINPMIGRPGRGVRINDAGEVAWLGPANEVELWRDGQVGSIGQDGLPKQDLQLNNAGQAAWAGGEDSRQQIYLYTPPAGVIPLPAGPSAAVSSLTVDPSPVSGGATAVGTVTLAHPAPAGGTVVRLASDDPAASLPAAVTVPAGATQTTFPVQTRPVDHRTWVGISAASGGSAQAVTLEVLPVRLVGLRLGPDPARGPAAATLTFTLSGPPPAEGLTIRLSADPPRLVSLADSYTWSGSGTTNSLPLMGSPVVAPTDVRITAAYAGVSLTTTLRLSPPAVQSLGLAVGRAPGGTEVEGEVRLSGAAPPGGMPVTVTSDHPAVASVPLPLFVERGTASALFGVTTHTPAEDTVVTLTAIAGGQSRSTTLTVLTAELDSVMFFATFSRGGAPVLGLITLTAPAPDGGAVVTLRSDGAAGASVPDRVFVPAGATHAGFSMTTQPVDQPIPVTVEAEYRGVRRTATIPIVPLGVAGLSLQPGSLKGGQTAIGTVTLNGPAGQSGLVVTLANDQPQAVTVPQQVTVPPGAASVRFLIRTAPVTTATLAHLSATAGGQTGQAFLFVLPPAAPGG